MKPKLIAIFLLLVLSPLALLAWLGWRATADEQARVREKFADVYTDQLASLRSIVHETIGERQREFANFLDLGLVKNIGEIRKLVRDQRFVRQAFIIDPLGNFTHPPADDALRTAQEREFFERTSSIWLSGEKFTSADEGTNPVSWVLTQNIPAVEPAQAAQGTPSQQAYSQQELFQSAKQQQRQLDTPNLPANFASDEGWYTWFYGDGVQIIYWRNIVSADTTLGIEVDREALMAEVIAKLPADTGAGTGRIVLADASSRPLYQWGEFEPAEKATPTASLALFPPLAMWQLNHFAPIATPGELSTGSILSLVSGIIAAAVALLALAIYFYRENSREMRTAAEKVTFVNQVSHELKTPLTNIRLYAELAEEKLPSDDDDGARKCLGIVVNESQRLSRLIGNVLTFAKPKANQIPATTANVIDDLIRATLEHFRPSLTAQGIEIQFDADASRTVRVDADLLEQVLGNLLSNVEKYAASGKHLKITSRQDEGSDLTTITVTDHGPGIPKTQRENVFKAFSRLSNKLSDGVSGTGIGLTIARDLARRHGGDLTLAEAKPNPGGCQFTLSLKTLEVRSQKRNPSTQN